VKKVVISLLSMVVIFCVIGLGVQAFVQTKLVGHPFKENKTQLGITVVNGDSITSIIDKLSNNGKLNNGFLLNLYIKSQKINTKGIKPGTAIISTDITLDAFIKILKTDKKDKSLVKVTFPEGFTIADIAAKLEKSELISKADFLSACKAYKVPDYIKSDPKRRYQLEGFLFPDTYEFKKGISGEEIITIMLDRFEYVINDIGEKQNKVINDEDIDKTINMAALVEKEAKAKDERAIVASVFYNRLKNGMKFESCATINYAMEKVITILSIKDTQFNSPYNTYINKGIPVGPICCPGRAAIEATLNPANTDYLFFVANIKKADGTMVFAKTLKEHNANVKKYEK